MGEPSRPAPRRSPLEHAVALARWIGPGRIVAVALSALAVGAGALWLLRSPDAADPSHAAAVPSVARPTLPTAVTDPDGPASPCMAAAGDCAPTASSASSSAAPPASVTAAVVHVAGAVAAPGVYTLGAGSRVGDAVRAAGGATPEAVLAAVNLAAPVADGQQVYVPHGGEATGPAPSAGADPAASAPVDLNTASADELIELPGVGPVLAAAIVRHREEAGPFTTVDDLRAVSGIGPARLETLRDLVRV